MHSVKKLWAKIKQIKHWEIYLAVIAVVIVVGIYFSTVGGKSTTTTAEGNSATISATLGETDYATQLENKLQTVLGSVAGAGKVAVLVMTDGEGTAELAYDTQEKTVTQTGTNGQEITTTTKEQKLITNNCKPLVLWTNPPTIVGIVIVATGASDVGVRLNLLRAVQTIIGDHQVSIQILSGN